MWKRATCLNVNEGKERPCIYCNFESTSFWSKDTCYKVPLFPKHCQQKWARPFKKFCLRPVVYRKGCTCCLCSLTLPKTEKLKAECWGGAAITYSHLKPPYRHTPLGAQATNLSCFESKNNRAELGLRSCYALSWQRWQVIFSASVQDPSPQQTADRLPWCENGEDKHNRNTFQVF